MVTAQLNQSFMKVVGRRCRSQLHHAKAILCHGQLELGLMSVSLHMALTEEVLFKLLPKQQLLSAGANPNGPVSPVQGCSALEAAAANNQLAIVAQLLAHGAMTASSPHRKSALHIAAGNGNDAIVALLLAYGCDLDATVWLSVRELEDDLCRSRRREYDVGPSCLAAENGHLSVLKILRKHGAKEKAADAACANGHLDVVL